MNGSEDNLGRGERSDPRPKLSSDPFTFASKEHIFFAHRAPWGEIKQSRAQIEALAEICVIGVTFPVRTIEVHNGYMFLAARGGSCEHTLSTCGPLLMPLGGTAERPNTS